MTPSEHDVRTVDGRTLRVLEDGNLQGRPVFFLHGTPGCRFLSVEQVDDARRQGIRLIGHDRPGYGSSTRKRGRRVGDEASDVVAIADALGIDRFAVYGYSGGGALALGCAAGIGHRLVGATCLAGVAPYPSEGLDWLAGLGDLNAEDFRLMLSDQAAWETKGANEMETMKQATPEQITEFVSSLLSDVDRAAFKGDVVDFLIQQLREGYRPGMWGGVDDSLSTALPWGFELSSVRVPTQIWHGTDDKFVPFAHGKWLAAHVPNAEAHLEKNEGHISLFLKGVPSIHKWLASKF
jgi:pimeloyl-ACP methyl ester carboxylesterase